MKPKRSAEGGYQLENFKELRVVRLALIASGEDDFAEELYSRRLADILHTDKGSQEVGAQVDMTASESLSVISTLIKVSTGKIDIGQANKAVADSMLDQYNSVVLD